MEIKNICDSLGIRLISYSPLGLGMLTGKYSPSSLPSGPRYKAFALLYSKFKQDNKLSLVFLNLDFLEQ